MDKIVVLSQERRRPDRRGKKRKEQKNKGPSRGARARQIFLSILAVGSMTAVMVTRGGGEAVEDVPNYLIGTWRTAAPAYLDRTFQIKKTYVVFRLPNQTRSYQIEGVSTKEDSSGTSIVLTYTGPDDSYPFSFMYRDGVVRFSNQDNMEWRQGTVEQVRAATIRSLGDSALSGEVSPLPVALLDCIKAASRTRTEDEEISCSDAVADSVVAKVLVNPDMPVPGVNRRPRR